MLNPRFFPPRGPADRTWLDTFARLAHAAVPGYELTRRAETVGVDDLADFVDSRDWSCASGGT